MTDAPDPNATMPCPWPLLQSICSRINPVLAKIQKDLLVEIHSADERTLIVLMPTMVRIERFKLLQFPDDVNMFDTLVAATSRGPNAADVIFDMLMSSIHR